MTTQPIPGMAFGAVAMFDVLGFKGIWTKDRSQGRWTPETVIQKMGYVREMVDDITKELQDNWPEDAIKLDARAMCLSDTVVVLVAVDQTSFTPYQDDPEATLEQNRELRKLSEANWILNSFACIKLASIISARAIGAGAVPPLPLFNYRGAISVGQFLGVRELDTFLGPAVDECAEAYEASQGAFVHLTRSALTHYHNARMASGFVQETSTKYGIPFSTDFTEIIDTPQLMPYDVPIRVRTKSSSGEPQTEVHEEATMVINPFITWSGDLWRQKSQELTELFGDSPQLADKKNNTAKFFDRILETELPINHPERRPR